MLKRLVHDAAMHKRWRAMATVVLAVLVTACSYDSPSAPTIPTADLGSCTNLEVPTGNTLALHTYATGVQIYRWNDTSWVFVSPSAVLTTDAARTNMIAIHFSGPTWQAIGGDRVVASVASTCKPSPDAIPWLLLGATTPQASSTFAGVKFIQRLNTTGGLAPSAPGASGQVVSVPYTAEYYFYR